MNQDIAKDFLGVGWKFPVEVDELTGRIKTSSYEEDIKEAIQIIIMTKKRERVMFPEFGCDISNYIFGVADYQTMVKIEKAVKEALLLWESRIIQVEVEAEPDYRDLGRININISYVVRSTNNPYNLVYPFFINEGKDESML